MPVKLPNENKSLTFSRGSASNRGKSQNKKTTWVKFKGLFRAPLATAEKLHAFKKMPDKEQQRLKNFNGWWIRCPVEGGVRNRHSILPSDLITLDVDYATPEFLERLRAGDILPQYELFAHSSRSHTPENPRLRIVIPVSSKIDADRYQAVSRIVAQMADENLEFVDKVSSRPAQMMFMPTVSKDMEKYYVFYEQGGELLDPEEVVETWETTTGLNSHNLAELPRYQGEDELREAAEEAEDPLDKKGPVGDFCRAYSITELVEGKDGEPGILGDVYEATEYNNGVITRMTYQHGSTSNGAVVYDDKFVFSHHGSDPAQEMLVNAYDLVRIHLYGDEDKADDLDAPMSKRPSVKAMTEFLRDDPNYRTSQAESRYQIDEDLLDDIPDEDDEEDEPEEADLDAEDLLGMPLDQAIQQYESAHVSRRRKKFRKPDKKWIAKLLDMTDDGFIKSTRPNVGYIIHNDPRWRNKLAYNEFSNQVVAIDDFVSKTDIIPSLYVRDRVNGDRWQDMHDHIIQSTLELPAGKGKPGYGLKVGKDTLMSGTILAAKLNGFHPVIEFLEECDETEEHAPEIIERIFIDYFGAEDTVYTRECSRILMIASVARVMEPGCKFDTAPILEGNQGIGKSTGVKRLYGAAWFGELDCDLGNRQEIAETIAGMWVMELPELTSLTKSEVNHSKAFMSRVTDDVRMAYGRHIEEFPRQCIVWGTTNNREYLRDPTGNRRFWPIFCDTDSVDTVGIMRDRRIIWKAAYQAYLKMRQQHPEGDLPLFLQGEAAEIAKEKQEMARSSEAFEEWAYDIASWMDEPLSLRALLIEQGHIDEAADPDTEYKGVSMDAIVVRVGFRQADFIYHVLDGRGRTFTNTQQHQNWNRCLEHMVHRMGWVRGENSNHTMKLGGKQAAWVCRPDMDHIEKANGFRLFDGDPASAGDIADDEVDDLI